MDIRFIPAAPRNTVAVKLAAESLENRDYAKTPAQWIVQDMDIDAVTESLQTMPASAVGSPMHEALKARLNQLTR